MQEGKSKSAIYRKKVANDENGQLSRENNKEISQKIKNYHVSSYSNSWVLIQGI